MIRHYYVGPPKPLCPCDAGRPQDCCPEDWGGAHAMPPCEECGLPIYHSLAHIRREA